MGHQPRAGRYAHALKPTVEDPEDAQRQHRGAETEQQVADRAENESRHEETARIAAVAPNAVDEFRESVNHAVEREKQAEVGFRNAHLLVQIRHGDAQILAHEVEKRISEDAHRDGTEFPVFETPYLLGGHTGIGRVRGFGLHRSIIFANGCATRSPAKRESPGANEAVRRTPRDNRFR